MIRRALLLAVASVACAAATTATAAGPPIQPRLTKALTGPSLSLGRTAALAVNAATGDVIYAHNSSLPVAPASNEKIPVSWAALTSLGTGISLPHRGLRHRHATGQRLGRRSDPQGLRRSDAEDGGPQSPGGNDLGTGDPDGQRADPRRRVVLRQQARRGGLEALLHRRRDATPLGPRRRSCARLAGPLAAVAGRASVPRRAHASRRHGRRPPGRRDRARGCDDARIRRLRPTLRDRAPHESRERQLLRRDAAQAAPRSRGQGRHLGGRRALRDRDDA